VIVFVSGIMLCAAAPASSARGASVSNHVRVRRRMLSSPLAPKKASEPMPRVGGRRNELLRK
jgi:hypothetical protein